jgi:hypothetical protein
MKTEPYYRNIRSTRNTLSLLGYLLLSGLLLAAIITLTSCDIPVAVAVEGQYGTYYYSSKNGLGMNFRVEGTK